MFFPETYSHKLGTIGTEVGGWIRKTCWCTERKRLSVSSWQVRNSIFQFPTKLPSTATSFGFVPGRPTGRMDGFGAVHIFIGTTRQRWPWDTGIGLENPSTSRRAWGLESYCELVPERNWQWWIGWMGWDWRCVTKILNSTCIIWKKHF